MSKVKILRFKNNKVAYATDNIDVQINKQKPESIEVTDINDDFFDDPKDKNISKVKNKWVVERKKR